MNEEYNLALYRIEELFSPCSHQSDLGINSQTCSHSRGAFNKRLDDNFIHRIYSKPFFTVGIILSLRRCIPKYSLSIITAHESKP